VYELAHSFFDKNSRSNLAAYGFYRAHILQTLLACIMIEKDQKWLQKNTGFAPKYVFYLDGCKPSPSMVANQSATLLQ